MWYVCVMPIRARLQLKTESCRVQSNAGDSRAVLSVDGKAIALSQDHKPGNPKETERIQKAGGHVEFGRVNGT